MSTPETGTSIQDEQPETASISSLEEQIKQLEKSLESEQKKSAELSKRIMYLQADLLNLQRQSEREVSEARESASARHLLELVSIKEDLERAMSLAGNDGQKSIREGLKVLLSRIESILRINDIERIEIRAGDHFDHRLHEAIAYSEGNGAKEGTVLSVVSNGYKFRGKVLKPVLVEIARRESHSTPQKNSATETNEEKLEVALSSEEDKARGRPQ